VNSDTEAVIDELYNLGFRLGINARAIKDAVERTDDVRELHLLLEFKLPEAQEEAFAVAEAAAAAESSDERVVRKAAVAATRQ
jgi:hypothetical protein